MKGIKLYLLKNKWLYDNEIYCSICCRVGAFPHTPQSPYSGKPLSYNLTDYHLPSGRIPHITQSPKVGKPL